MSGKSEIRFSSVAGILLFVTTMITSPILRNKTAAASRWCPSWRRRWRI